MRGQWQCVGVVRRSLNALLAHHGLITWGSCSMSDASRAICRLRISCLNPVLRTRQLQVVVDGSGKQSCLLGHHAKVGTQFIRRQMAGVITVKQGYRTRSAIKSCNILASVLLPSRVARPSMVSFPGFNVRLRSRYRYGCLSPEPTDIPEFSRCPATCRCCT